MAAEVEVLFHLHESSSLSGNLLVLSFQLRRRWAALSQAVSCTQDSGNTEAAKELSFVYRDKSLLLK